jgi:hypothetical protein
MKPLGESLRGLLFLFGTSITLACQAETLPQHAGLPQTNSVFLFHQLISLDPRSDANLKQMVQIADSLSGVKKISKESKTGKKSVRRSEQLKDLPTTELQKLFTEEADRHETRVATAIERLALEALSADSLGGRESRIGEIQEIQTAARNQAMPPVPTNLGVFTTWIFFLQNASGKIGRGTTPATNLATLSPGEGDRGRIGPLPSTIWRRPSDISHEDLYAGFGRERLPQLGDLLFDYSAPKTSSGTHAGFDVEWEGQRLKIKFGEVNSEPLTARIFDALGYHVDPTDYAPRIKIHYDRRMLREFHLRKPLNMRITPLGIHVGTIRLQTRYDPFTFITTAVFKDGHQISGSGLKHILFRDPAISHPEDLPENFRPEVEASLDYLIIAPANVQPRDIPAQPVGSWDYESLGHMNRRELRGAGLLAAWLSWFDSRPDNTKLRILKQGDEIQLQHFFTDLGGGLGAATGWFSPRGENPNDLTWTFTEPEILRGRGHMTTPFRVEHFKPVVPTPAFAAITTDDARWMARLIGQLTEEQLRAALVASGYDNAEAKLYLEKLISRRDRMIRDLGLEKEIPLLRPNGQDFRFYYSPAKDGPFEARLADGSVAVARSAPGIIAEGKLSVE